MKTKFKKLGLAAVLLAIVMLPNFGTSVLYSFDSPYDYTQSRCADPCFEPNWDYGTVTVNIGDCIFIVHYKFADCVIEQETHHQLQITGFEFLTGDCNSIDENILTQHAVRFLLAKASDIFNDNSDFAYYWVRLPACWEWDELDLRLLPCQCQNCELMECCVTWYEVDQRTPPDKVSDIVYQNSPWDECGELSGVTCFAICDSSRVPEQTPLLNETHLCDAGCGIEWDYYPLKYVDGYDNNCGFRAFYATRFCNNVPEFIIYRIELDANCGNNSLDNDIYMKAIRYTLKDYALSRQSGGNYKLRSKRCWHKFNDSTAIHCPSECCYADYNVTLYGNQVMLNSSDPNDPGGSCSPCSYICDDQDLEGGWLPKISDYGLGIAESNNNFVYIQPNPASGKLDLIFLSVNTGKFILRVFDCIGNEVHKESINKELTEYKVEINVSNYSSGMYYYQFSQNGFIAIRGKFIIKH